jgi:hypothetical protein
MSYFQRKFGLKINVDEATEFVKGNRPRVTITQI